MLFFVQNLGKSPQNWGPPSLRMDVGQTRVLNHVVRTVMTAFEEKENARCDEGVAAPVVHADKERFATEAEKVEADVLHGVSKMT